jgi:LuxR family maltose regulon positive regulatory protein
MVLEGQIRLYLESIRALPPDTIRSRPVLCVADALAQILDDWENRERVERRLQAAERAVAGSPADADLVRGYATAVRSVVERVGGGSPARIIQLSKQAQRLLPENLLVRYFIDLNLYFAHLIAGEVETAVEVIREAYRAERSLRNPYLGVTLAASYGQLLLRQGRLREALALYRDAVERFVDPSEDRRPPFAELVYGGIGRVLVEMNDLEAAGRELDRDPGRFPPGDETLEMYVHLDHARLCWARGDPDGARRALHHARAERFVKTKLYVDAFEARASARQGELARAETWAQEARVELVVEPFSGGTQEGVLLHVQRAALVQVAIARQRRATAPEESSPNTAVPTMKEVLDYLEGQLAIDEAGGWWSHVLNRLILRALAYDALGQRELALDALEEALRLAAPEGFARIFIDEGAPMARLLYDIVSREANRETAIQRHARRLLTGFQPLPERGEDESDPDVVKEALVEPLSERELEVLVLIAEGLTNPEIAERLYISLHTVKSHAGNLYGKLDVSNRTQAVQKAQILGLL